MSTLEALQARAEKAAQALQDAQAKAREAAEGAEIRNAERRTAFWESVRANDLPVAQQALEDARTAFSVAVAEAGDVVGAHVAYVRAYDAHAQINNAVCDGLLWMVNDRTGQRHDEGWGRAVYPAGMSPSHHAADAFLAMLERETAMSSAAHCGEVMGGLWARLRGELEPEGEA